MLVLCCSNLVLKSPPGFFKHFKKINIFSFLSISQTKLREAEPAACSGTAKGEPCANRALPFTRHCFQRILWTELSASLKVLTHSGPCISFLSQVNDFNFYMTSNFYNAPCIIFSAYVIAFFIQESLHSKQNW